jgi:hypothetical protein
MTHAVTLRMLDEAVSDFLYSARFVTELWDNRDLDFAAVAEDDGKFMDCTETEGGGSTIRLFCAFYGSCSRLRSTRWVFIIEIRLQYEGVRYRSRKRREAFPIQA